jgi:hypothetical protein
MSALNSTKDSNRSFVLDSSSNRTAKRLDDPTLSNRAFAIFFIVTILIAIMLLIAPRAGAATVSWNGTTGKWEASTWTGGVGTAPPTATDAAVIGNRSSHVSKHQFFSC